MRIIFTTDTHGHLYPIDYCQNSPENTGLFCVAGQIEKDGNTLVLDGGDTLQGTPLVAYYLSHRDMYDFNPMAEGFNAMGLDYYTLGNHDFNFGYDAILDFVSQMKATLISANVEDKRGALNIKKSALHVLEDGTRVGITAAVTGFVNVWEKKENLTELVVTDPVEAVAGELEKLRDNCDITVCIYHGGFEEDLKTGKKLSDTKENQACEIARNLDFDIILTGHQHIAIDSVNIEGTHGVQPPDKAGHYAELKVEGSRGAWNISSELVPVKGVSDAAKEIIAAHDFMEPMTKDLDKWLDEPIGSIWEEIPVEQKLDIAMHGSKVANLFNEAQLRFAKTDFSCTSLSNDPLGLHKETTIRDVLGIYKFSNTMEVKSVTKAVLKEALERCAEYFDYDPATGRVAISNVFLQPKVEHYNYDFYANLWYEFDLTKPVGERVVVLKKLDGTELEDDKEYTLVTSNYRATGTGGYECIGNAPLVRSYSEEMPDILIDYIRENSPVPEPVNARIGVRC